MVRRYELTDGQYRLVADLMPAGSQRGGRWNDHRTVLNGIVWMLSTGAQRRELPERYGNWKSVYHRRRRSPPQSQSPQSCGCRGGFGGCGSDDVEDVDEPPDEDGLDQDEEELDDPTPDELPPNFGTSSV